MAKWTSTALVVVAAGLLAGGGVALGSQQSPGHGREPANIGQVESDVKAYYGDTVDADGVHQPSPTGQWARQTAQVVAEGKSFLARRLTQHVRQPAIVLDVDDTSETTFGYEVAQQFAYNPAIAEQWIDNGQFPAIKPTLELAQWAAQHGVRVFFLTGRPEHQRTATLADLAKDGYPTPAGAYLKPEGQWPAYLSSCAPTCTTTQYKSLTRAYIESQGNDIVLNLGDQFSDLDGGHAERPVKLPNPMYYLP